MILVFKLQSLPKVCVRLTLPAQEAVPGQAISVALGQFGVKTNDFIKQFNDLTLVYPKGLHVSVIVLVLRDGSFKIENKGPCLLYLLKCFLNDQNEINIKSFLVILEFISKFKFLSMDKISFCRSILGCLKSRNFILIF